MALSLSSSTTDMAEQWQDPTVIDNIIHEGYLYKKGKLNKSWKKRYFILYRDRKLKYFSSKPPSSKKKRNLNDNNNESNVNNSNKKSKEIGFINLYLVTGVSTHNTDSDQVYDLNNPNIKKNTSYYEEQDIFRQLSKLNGKRIKKKSSSASYFDNLKHQRALTFHGNGTSKAPLIEYIYKLYTPKRIWYLKCKNEESMNKWTTYIKQVVYGNVLYESHLLIQETNNNKINLMGSTNKVWKSRWCVLTDKYHLRIYEDQTQSKYKQCLRMEQLNMICYSDGEQFRYYNNRREYPMNLTRSDKKYTIATLSHKSREIWMDKFSQLMKVYNMYC